MKTCNVLLGLTFVEFKFFRRAAVNTLMIINITLLKQQILRLNLNLIKFLLEFK